jgi:hypothetical protein
MTDRQGYPAPIDRLSRAGDPRDTWQWEQGDPDYVKQFGLGSEHIPSLIEIARQWTEDAERPEDDVLYAPVHAWRALGQLRAVEAVEPLLAMQNAMDEQSPDWYLEEFHEVFGWIGPPAIPAIVAYMADRKNAEFPRGSAAHGLCEIAKRNPEVRDQVVEVLTRQLALHEMKVYSLNAFLIGHLTDLKAVESAEVIERAYAAGVVDEMVCGSWTSIRKELGVEGMGLVPDKEDAPYGRLSPRPRFPHVPAPDYGDRDRNREREKKEKAKRRQQEKAKKRNRKRR